MMTVGGAGTQRDAAVAAVEPQEMAARRSWRRSAARRRSSGPDQPVQLAPVDVLLASQEGSHITGDICGVTGGMGIA